MDDRSAAEARFSRVFEHLGLITAYARRRGAREPEEIAAEAMAIAWRRLADVPAADPRPWLIATARNLLLADRRRRGISTVDVDGVEPPALPSAGVDLDPELETALRSVSAQDREALLLVAWEDLTPAAAAASLGISPAAFRVRLHRARRRLIYELESRARRVPSVDNCEPRLEQL